MRKLKVLARASQRNGVSGNSFLTFIVTRPDFGAADRRRRFVLTVETQRDEDETASRLAIETCRVVDPADPLLGWRGDEFAFALQRVLDDERCRFCGEPAHPHYGAITGAPLCSRGDCWSKAFEKEVEAELA